MHPRAAAERCAVHASRYVNEALLTTHMAADNGQDSGYCFAHQAKYGQYHGGRVYPCLCEVRQSFFMCQGQFRKLFSRRRLCPIMKTIIGSQEAV